MTTDLDWFYDLPPAEQSVLLRDPYANVNGPLAVRLAKNGPGVYGSVPSTDGLEWKLSPEFASKLSAIRLQLDHWWQSIETDQQAYIVENRSDELAGEYHDVVQAASLDPITHAPHGHLVVLVSDNKTGRFRLPAMIRTYVDLKAEAFGPSAVRPQ